MSRERAINFDQRKTLANESLIMACLQIYRELLSLATFLRVHSNSNEIFSHLACDVVATSHFGLI